MMTIATLTRAGLMGPGQAKRLSDLGSPSDYAKAGAIGAAGLSMATGKLIGRTAEGAGAPEEIATGRGLLLSSGSLAWKGFEQIATLPLSGEAAADFLSIPQSFDELLFLFEGLSHNGGSSQVLTFSISNDNGTTWSSASSVSTSIAATASLSGYLSVTGYGSKASLFAAGISALDFLAISTGSSVVNGVIGHPGGMDAARFKWATTVNFDVGAITLSGR